MKIIGKHKDYYDYLQGVYGIDEKIVYDRRNKSSFYKPEFNPNLIELLGFALCGVIYVLHTYKGNFYFGHDIKRILNAGKRNDGGEYDTWKLDEFDLDTYMLNQHLTKTKINEAQNNPVCMLRPTLTKDGWRLHEWEVCDSAIRLSDFGFPQIISPHDMYIAISNFLSREKPVKDNRTDIQKIVGHGFDKKKSFRNM